MPDGVEDKAISYIGIGIAIGAGAGVVMGALVGGPAVAIGLLAGAGGGLVIGAALDATRQRRSRDTGDNVGDPSPTP